MHQSMWTVESSNIYTGNKTGNVSSKANYRPIALTSVLKQVFETALLSKLESVFETSDYQFGFKSHHSTDLCIYTLKEIVEYYKSHSTSVYICFMDASKAFDRVNHWTLFKKMIDSGMPPIFVRLIVTWYCEQHGAQRYPLSLMFPMVCVKAVFCLHYFLTCTWID